MPRRVSLSNGGQREDYDFLTSARRPALPWHKTAASPGEETAKGNLTVLAPSFLLIAHCAEASIAGVVHPSGSVQLGQLLANICREWVVWAIPLFGDDQGLPVEPFGLTQLPRRDQHPGHVAVGDAQVALGLGVAGSASASRSGMARACR